MSMIVNQQHLGSFLSDLTDIIEGRASADVARNVSNAIAMYVRQPAKSGRVTLHNMTTSADIPDSITGNASTFLKTANYDMGYELAFQEVPVEPGRNFFEIETIRSGLTFRRVAEGESIRVEGLTGEIAPVYCDKYGGAIGWTDEMIRYRKVSIMQQRADAFRAAFWKSKADQHYKLIGATVGAGHITAYDTTGATQLDKDINTLNAAAYALASRLKDSYVGDPLAQSMVIYFDPTLWSRIVRALSQTAQEYAGSVSRVLYSIRPVPTFNRNVTNSVNRAALVMPGYQNQRATIMEPTPVFAVDHLSLSYVQSVWSYYGAAVSADQVQFVDFA